MRNKLTHIITRLNTLRRKHPALQQTNNIHFCGLENPNMLAFYKWDASRRDELLIVISLDDANTQQGSVRLPWEQMGEAQKGVEVYDLVTQAAYHWDHEWNFVELHPHLPFHIFQIRR